MADAESRTARTLVDDHVGNFMCDAEASPNLRKEEIDFDDYPPSFNYEPRIAVQQSLSDLSHTEMLQNAAQRKRRRFRPVCRSQTAGYL